MCACSANGSGSEPSATAVEPGPSGEVVDVVTSYFDALEDRDWARAVELRCESEALDPTSQAAFRVAVDDLRTRLETFQVEDVDVNLIESQLARTMVTLRSSGDEIQNGVVYENDEWKMCGQGAEESEKVSAGFEVPHRPLPVAADDLSGLLDSLDIDGWERSLDDPAAVEATDGEREIVGRRAVRFERSGAPDATALRIELIQYSSEDAAVLDQIFQEGLFIDNAVAAVDTSSEFDRGFRYLASFATFAQPSTVGPYWDALWLRAGSFVMVVSEGPLRSIDSPSEVSDVSELVQEQLLSG